MRRENMARKLFAIKLILLPEECYLYDGQMQDCYFLVGPGSGRALVAAIEGLRLSQGHMPLNVAVGP